MIGLKNSLVYSKLRFLLASGVIFINCSSLTVRTSSSLICRTFLCLGTELASEKKMKTSKYFANISCKGESFQSWPQNVSKFLIPYLLLLCHWQKKLRNLCLSSSSPLLLASCFPTEFSTCGNASALLIWSSGQIHQHSTHLRSQWKVFVFCWKPQLQWVTHNSKTETLTRPIYLEKCITFKSHKWLKIASVIGILEWLLCLVEI